MAIAGKDATEDFEEIGHSNNARELLAKYEIGEYEVRLAGWLGGGMTLRESVSPARYIYV